MPAGLLGPLIQLATIVILTHWLRPAELGVYALAVAVQDLAQIVTLSWWSQYILRYLDDARPDSRAAQDRTEIAVLVGATVLQILAVAGAMILIAAPEPPDPLLLAAVALAGAVRALVGHWSVRARAAEQIGLYALAQIGGPGLTLVLTLAAFAVVTPSATIVFLAMALGHAIVAVPLAGRARYASAAVRLDRTLLAAAFRYGIFTTLGAGLAWVSMQSVRFVTDVALGAWAVGLLHVGWGVGQRLSTQLGVLATQALFPIAAGKARSEGIEAGVRQLAPAAPVLLAVLTPAVIAAFLLAEPAAALLVAAEYQSATATILPIATLAGAIRVFRHHYLDEVLQLAEEPHLMAKLDGLEAGLALLLSAIGAVAYGLTGAVLGALAATTVATLAGWRLIARRYGTPLTPRDALAAGGASAAMVLALALMPAPMGLVGLLGTGALAGAAYAAVFAAIDYKRARTLLREARRGS
jgi:O-antigen/teichoic acid export membrane protein